MLFFSPFLLPRSNKFRSSLNCHRTLLPHLNYLYACIKYMRTNVGGVKLPRTRLSGHPFSALPIHYQSSFITVFFSLFVAAAADKFPNVIRVQKLNSLFIVRLMVCIQLQRSDRRRRVDLYSIVNATYCTPFFFPYALNVSTSVADGAF